MLRYWMIEPTSGARVHGRATHSGHHSGESGLSQPRDLSAMDAFVRRTMLWPALHGKFLTRTLGRLQTLMNQQSEGCCVGRSKLA